MADPTKTTPWQWNDYMSNKDMRRDFERRDYEFPQDVIRRSGAALKHEVTTVHRISNPVSIEKSDVAQAFEKSKFAQMLDRKADRELERHNAQIVNLCRSLLEDTKIMGEIDAVNQRVARALSIPIDKLYPAYEEGQFSGRRMHKTLVEDYAKFQRASDFHSETKTAHCNSCGVTSEKSVAMPVLSFQQKTDMSAAWSRELRAKVEASEAARKAAAPSVRVDLEYEDWE